MKTHSEKPQKAKPPSAAQLKDLSLGGDARLVSFTQVEDLIALDEKNRIHFPSHWRKSLGVEQELCLYPLPDGDLWGVAASNAAEFGRWLKTDAYQPPKALRVKLDTKGRITLPDEFVARCEAKVGLLSKVDHFALVPDKQYETRLKELHSDMTMRDVFELFDV